MWQRCLAPLGAEAMQATGRWDGQGLCWDGGVGAGRQLAGRCGQGRHQARSCGMCLAAVGGRALGGFGGASCVTEGVSVCFVLYQGVLGVPGVTEEVFGYVTCH